MKELGKAKVEISAIEPVAEIKPFAKIFVNLIKTFSQLEKELKKGVKNLKLKFAKYHTSKIVTEIENAYTDEKTLLALMEKPFLLEENAIYIAVGNPHQFESLLSQSSSPYEALWNLMYNNFRLRVPYEFAEKLMQPTVEDGLTKKIANFSIDDINLLTKTLLLFIMQQNISKKTKEELEKLAYEHFFLAEKYANNEKQNEILENTLLLSMFRANFQDKEDWILKIYEISKDNVNVETYSANLYTNESSLKDVLKKNIRDLLNLNLIKASKLLEATLENNKKKYNLVIVPSCKIHKKYDLKTNTRYARFFAGYLSKTYNVKTLCLRENGSWIQTW